MTSGLRLHVIGRAAACFAAVLAVAASLRAAEPAEPAAVRYARHDLARWTERLPAVTASAAQGTAALEAASKALADAKAAHAAAEKLLAEAPAALAALDQARAQAAKATSEALDALRKVEAEKRDDAASLAAAREAVAQAARQVEAATRQAAEISKNRKQAEAAKPQLEKSLPALEAAIKPATDQKAAADKALAEAQTLHKTAQERLTVLEKSIQPDPAATRLVQTLTHPVAPTVCRFDVAGDHLFAGARDEALHRFDLFTASAIHPVAHRSWMGAMVFLPPSQTQLVTGGQEGLLVWWNSLDPQAPPLRTIPAHKGSIRALAVSPDGALLASAGNDNLVKIWSTAEGTLLKELAGHTRHVYSVAFHPSGKALVSGDLLGVIRQWDTGTWETTRELDAKVLWKYDTGFRADVGGVRGFAFSPDGTKLAAAGITEVSNAFAGIGVPCVVLLDWESGKQLKLMKPKDAFQGTCWGVRFAPDGSFIVAAGGGGSSGAIWFWKPDDEKSFHDVKLPGVAYDMDLHPDGLRIAVPLFDNTLRIYDMSAKPEAPAAAK